MPKKHPIKRKYIRYKPDPYLYVLIDDNTANATFTPAYSGLIIEEAYGGCTIVTSVNLEVKKLDRISIKIDNMPLMQAEIRWQRKLDANLIKIGAKYSDI